MRLSFLFLFLSHFAFAQFAPPVGQAGTTALYKDSSAFITWANFCVLQRGLQDISNSAGPRATVGDSSKAIGIADNGIVSLGDGGIAICTFAQPIADGPGNDFAVFENSFSDDYLEFAFVEVSSDGINFFRFPPTCNIQDTVQTDSFGTSDATLVNNLAGKYRGSYGTPFDLAELQGTSGLNANNITHVKIIDVVGSVNPLYTTYDKNNHKINDPWPTAFGSGGFDLDAVGVIHTITNSIAENILEENILVYPNPGKGIVNLECRIQNENTSFQILDIFGNAVKTGILKSKKERMDLMDLSKGIYFIMVKTKDQSFIKKIIITE